MGDPGGARGDRSDARVPGSEGQIHVSSSDISNLFYNADNEWYQTTDQNNNVNLVNWDAAGNLLGNNGFGGMSPPLTVTYNAKEQTATQTDINQYPSPMTFTGRGQGKQVSETTSVPNGPTNPTTTNFVYSLLGLTQTDGAPIPYVRDPSGTLVSQQVSGGPYYDLSDGQGSVAGTGGCERGTSGGLLLLPRGECRRCRLGNGRLGKSLPVSEQLLRRRVQVLLDGRPAVRLGLGQRLLVDHGA